MGYESPVVEEETFGYENLAQGKKITPCEALSLGSPGSSLRMSMFAPAATRPLTLPITGIRRHVFPLNIGCSLESRLVRGAGGITWNLGNQVPSIVPNQLLGVPGVGTFWASDCHHGSGTNGLQKE